MMSIRLKALQAASSQSDRVSPIAAGGRIYLVSETGETIVMRAARTPEGLARNRIDARLLASPALSGGRLFVRSDDQLIAIVGRAS